MFCCSTRGESRNVHELGRNVVFCLDIRIYMSGKKTSALMKCLLLRYEYFILVSGNKQSQSRKVSLNKHFGSGGKIFGYLL